MTSIDDFFKNRISFTSRKYHHTPHITEYTSNNFEPKSYSIDL